MRALPSEMCISTERHALKSSSAPKYERPIANSAAIAGFRVPLKRALGVFLKSINSNPRKTRTVPRKIRAVRIFRPKNPPRIQRGAKRQYSDANMIVSTGAVFAGSLGSSEPLSMFGA